VPISVKGENFFPGAGAAGRRSAHVTSGATARRRAYTANQSPLAASRAGAWQLTPGLVALGPSAGDATEFISMFDVMDLPRFSGHSEKHEKCDKSVTYGKGESAKAEVVFGRIQGRGGEVGKEKWQERGLVGLELGLGERALRRWVHQYEIDAGGGGAGALTTGEREELAQLRRDNQRLRMEREILKNYRIPHCGITCWTRNSAGDYG